MAKMCNKCHKYVYEDEIVCPFCNEPFGLTEYIDPLFNEPLKTGKVNPNALIGFILSFFTLSVLGGILAVYFCVKGILDSRRYVNHRGRGLAIAGLVIVFASVLIFILLQLGLVFLSKTWEPVPDENAFSFFCNSFLIAV